METFIDPICNDERIGQFLINLHDSYHGKDYNINYQKGKISLSDLDILSKRYKSLLLRKILKIFSELDLFLPA